MGGVLSLLKSRKFWLAMAGILAVVGVIPLAAAEALADHFTEVVLAVAAIVAVLIHAIGAEDAAAKSGTLTAAKEVWRVTTPVVPVTGPDKPKDETKAAGG